MSWITEITGKNQRRAADRAEARAVEDRKRGQKIEDTYLMPALQEYIGQLNSDGRAFDTLSGINRGMLSGDMSKVPDFLRAPGTSAEEMKGYKDSLSTIARTDLGAQADAEANKMAQFNAGRGVAVSAEKSKLAPGYSRWWAEAKDKAGATVELTANEEAARRRQEAVSNWMNTNNVLSSYRVNGPAIASTIAGNAYGNSGANQALSAQQLSQSGAQMGSFVSGLVNLGMFGAGGGFSDPSKTFQMLTKG